MFLPFCDSTTPQVSSPTINTFDSKGRIRVCDLGESGESVNSIADTSISTSSYTNVNPTTLCAFLARGWLTIGVLTVVYSPNAFKGVKPDVWLLGVSLSSSRWVDPHFLKTRLRMIRI